MLIKTTCASLTIFSLLFSSVALAQSYKSKPGETLPKQWFIEKYLHANPLLPATILKQEVNKRFNYKKMPLDNMICVSPGKGFTNHIKVYNPGIRADYPSVRIPNAISKIDVIK